MKRKKASTVAVAVIRGVMDTIGVPATIAALGFAICDDADESGAIIPDGILVSIAQCVKLAEEMENNKKVNPNE